MLESSKWAKQELKKRKHQKDFDQTFEKNVTQPVFTAPYY
ncbi:hypothetical protein VCSRO191_3107 [Vibrio cholerae]|nr:hypothetical protein VCSRO191_3107 [Vibrio cholerae]